MKDPYETLGIAKNASKADIKKAYRKLAKEFHPDRNKEANAADKFKDVTEAYELLMDDAKRSAYDQYGFAGTQGFGGQTGNGFEGFQGFNSSDFGFNDLGDIFDSFFSGGTGYQRRNRKGDDLQVKLELDFMEAIFGTEKTIKYRRQVVCDLCQGLGSKKGSKSSTCQTCKGAGRVTQVQRTFIGNIQTTVTCPTCEGNGEVIADKCEKCGGDGIYSESEELKVKIPKGTPDGLTLRFATRGNAGKKNAGYGDLYIEFEIKPHEYFERSGDDIYLDFKIPITSAVLGDEVDVETVHGKVKVKIPTGTQSGRVIRLKGLGVPKLKKNENGDQYLRVKVVVPEKLTRNQKKLWEELRKIENEKPGFLDEIF
ncbi:MAG: molecular chaperone DnaJ [bacterium]